MPDRVPVWLLARVCVLGYAVLAMLDVLTVPDWLLGALGVGVFAVWPMAEHVIRSARHRA